MPPVFRPTITELYDRPVPPKKRTLSVPAGSTPTFETIFTDRNGDPVDLTPYASAPYTIASAVREQLSPSRDALFDVMAIQSPATDGKVRGILSPKTTAVPGIYILEIVITDDTNRPRAVSSGEVVTASGALSSTVWRITTQPLTGPVRNYDYPLTSTPIVAVGTVLTAGQQLVREVVVVLSCTHYLFVEPGLHGVGGERTGPPSLAEVRLHLRDYPENNMLLDEYEFDESEIALAIVRPIEYFNERPPPLSQRYSTTDFPYRYYWLEGICWQLFLSAANWYRRNRMPYQAGGLAVDDTNKEKEYLQAAQIYGQSYQDWVKLEKVRINMEAGFGCFGSDYGRRW